MDAKKAREFYQDYLDTIYHEHRVDQLERFYAPDVICHPTPPGMAPGLAGVKLIVQAWMEAFPDFHITLNGFVHDKDLIAPRITLSGTHKGTFMGVPASGRRFEISDHPHYRLDNGRIVELWDNPDMLTMLQQLGILPPLPS